MITPSFRLTQDDIYLTVTIRAPYTNIRDSEVIYDERSFVFVSKPYFLRLFLPCDVVDDESGKANYDAEMGVFTICVPKKNRGEFFPNLEMLSELLKPQNSYTMQQTPTGRPMVEELLSDTTSNVMEDKKAEDNANGDLNSTLNLNENGDELFAKQQLNNDDDFDDGACAENACREFGYGFAWRRHGVLKRFIDETHELVDVRDADATHIDKRAELCRRYDVEKFNADHYLADLFEPDEYVFPSCMQFELTSNTHLALDDADRDRLKNLQRRKLPTGVCDASSNEARQIARSLVDLLAAYLYDMRFTNAEVTSESGWHVAKLSPSLSFLVRWSDTDEALEGFARRALVYPLIRHWEMVERVVADLQVVLCEGRTAILKCLLSIYAIFNQNSAVEIRYLFNQLFIEDYLLWIQAVDERVLGSLTADVRAAASRLTKNSLADLELERVEMAGSIIVMQRLGIDVGEESAVGDSNLNATKNSERSLNAIETNSNNIEKIDSTQRNNSEDSVEALDSDDDEFPAEISEKREEKSNGRTVDEKPDFLSSLCSRLKI